MKTSVSGLNFIKSWEGFLLKSYRCVAGVWTIGYGSTYYEDGTKVKAGDTITRERADELLKFEVGKIEKVINDLGLNITQPQFDALVSFAFNVGPGALKRSTLLKVIRRHPGSAEIRAEFMKWNIARVNGVLTPVRGLTRRRTAEANMYFG